jgi:hypothetical protein
MSELPVSERINRAFFEVLSTVNTANGYSHDLSFQRIRKTNHSAHLNCVIDDTLPESILAQSPFGTQEVERTITVSIFISPSDGDETPTATFHALIQRDLAHAVMSDPQLGGLVMDTTPEESDLLYADDETNCGLLVGWRVRYRYAQADPCQSPT